MLWLLAEAPASSIIPLESRGSDLSVSFGDALSINNGSRDECFVANVLVNAL